ncbi:MAG: M15 family metallopeptidase [Candidatus Berkelbacteria bacterium]|nr:M15 family metallopeptidase [Candidatus Berkelbacteria bacterium]
MAGGDEASNIAAGIGLPALGGAFGLAVIGVGIIIPLALFSIIKLREPVKETSTTAGQTTCSTWGNAPAGFQTAITTSANKVGIQPALLGAIFLDEHGNNWARPNADGTWARGGRAVGPYQIEDFDNKWKTVTEDGYSSKVYCAPSTTAPAGKTCVNVESIEDSSLAAADFIKHILTGAKLPPTTADKNEVRCTGAGYNAGPAKCTTWKNAGYPEDSQPHTTDEYHNRTWVNFQKLFVGCQSSAAQAGTAPDSGNVCGVTAVDKSKITIAGSPDARLMPPAAKNFNELADEYAKDTGNKLVISSMYRTHHKQICLCMTNDTAEQAACMARDESSITSTDYLKANGKCKNTNANPPGASMHEAGLAFDINIKSFTEAQWNVLKTIAPNFNFNISKTSKGVFKNAEAWHFDYIGLENQYWYGAPKISNAITSANKTCN